MKSKTIAFDLDGVLCYRTTEEGAIAKYKTCKPLLEMIKITNQCYDNGYKIIIYTARGMNSYKGNVALVYSNLYELTKKQLKDWGIKYHQLVMGKQHYDLLIDDKAVNSLHIGCYNDVDAGVKP